MEEEYCNLSLGLGIGDGCASSTTSRGDHGGRKRSPFPFDIFFLTQSEDHEEKKPGYMPSSRKLANNMEEEDVGVAKESSNGWEPRKKLRLTREQSEFLEESFEEHNTLNPMRKQELAERLGLRPRQVEIWFQNRRARTKLKQTEVNCELLKKYCESLKNENRRLKREVQELKSMNVWPSSACLQLSNNTLTPSICTSCRLCGDDDDDRSKNPAGFNLVLDKLKLYSSGSKDSSLTC